jgi:hypothetical protein
MNTSTETQVQIQDKLVEIDNLITALEYLKQNLESNIPSSETIVEQVLQRIDHSSIENRIAQIGRSYFNNRSYLNDIFGPIIREIITPEVNQDIVNEVVRSFTRDYITGSTFQERVVSYLKRYALPRWKDEILQANKQEIDNHLENYVLTKIDERVAAALSKQAS